MCTTYTTKNRATLFNHYTVQTLLLDHNAYCPCGPNRQDYSYRSRIYNPDPKYQCHSDMTCHTYDSIPKGISCCGYGGPSPPYPINPGQIPCFADGPCYPPNENCTGGDDFDPCKPQRCKRRVRRVPECCPPRSTYRDLICSFECCDPCPPCEEPCDQGQEQDICTVPQVNDGGYSVCLPKDVCGAKITYNCDPCGNICRTMETCGNQVQSECAKAVILETCGPCGPCGDGCVGIKGVCCTGPCSDPCCSPPSCGGSGDCCPLPCGFDPCCPRVCDPQPICKRPCKRPLLRCPLRTHNYCRCMSCSPRFWICQKPNCCQ